MVTFKKALAVLCACSLFSGTFAYAGELTGLPRILEDFSDAQKSELEEIISISKEDAISSAARINEIEDADAYDLAVREVLDEYYGAKSSEADSKIAQFAQTIDNRAADILKNYEEAKKERDSAETLDYEPGRVLVSFYYGTPETTIAEVAQRMGSGYSILNDNAIDETLPDYKLDRIKAAENMEFPVIVSMDIGLDKTVQRAITMLGNVSCVESASANYRLGLDLEVPKTEIPQTETTQTKPDTPALKTKAIGSKKVRLTWKKVTGADGYEIYRKAGSGKFKKIKTLKAGKTKYVVKKLKLKKYTFKMRAFKKENGVRVYSDFSKVRKVQMKK